MLDNLKIGTKLIGMQAVVLVLLIVIGVSGILGMAQIKAGLQTVYEDRAVALVQLGQVLDSIHRIRGHILSASGAENDQVRDELLARFDAVDQIRTKFWKEYMATYLTPEEEGLARKFQGDWESYDRKRQSTAVLLKKGVRDRGLFQAIADAGAAFDKARDGLKDLIGLQERVAKEEYEKASDLYGNLRTGGIALILIALAAAGLLSLLVFRSIAGRVSEMTGIMQRLAHGDNGVTVPSVGTGDEIGTMADTVQVFKDGAIAMEQMRADQERQRQQAEQDKRRTMNGMADQFEASVKSVVTGVSAAARQLQTTAQHMSANADQTKRQSMAVASAAEHASANVQTVASATEELTCSVNEISRQVSESSRIAGVAVEEANRTNATIAGLVEAAQKIGEVVQLINTIASQTNSLLLRFLLV
ncbi:methyl-accepting chemotaxis protein [uncultured Gammaproteobacteria bacterium]